MRAFHKQEIDSKPLSIDERHIELKMERKVTDREETRITMEKQKGIIEVISGLAKQLD